MRVQSIGFRCGINSLLILCILGLSQLSFACGGFFCSSVPIVQAGEQIVFRQQGGETTAMIKINYAGTAEDFGWVLPVPETPEISLGSDLIFTELEANTRPQFILDRNGIGCVSFGWGFGGASPEAGNGIPADPNPSVNIVQSFSIGGFDVQVVSSDDSEALALWLAKNNFDLSSRGAELLQPYIAAKSKFVVLKLKSNSQIGDIQPIILKYKSDVPVIPMTLTAVAAQDNMGVLVWLLGDGRAVPKNFKHVIPNYTRLNWTGGAQAAYVSYQNLITEAMDEAGGQGFATDFAGYMPELSSQFTSDESWQDILKYTDLQSDAKFIANAWNQLNAIVQTAIQGALPTSSGFVYQRAEDLLEVFSLAELKQARSIVSTVIQEQVTLPLNNSRALFDDNLYLTRLYTTLSANEMTTNPEFTFNTAMEDRPLARRATLTGKCRAKVEHWTLELGEGTGREGEVVVDIWEQPITLALSNDQSAVWRVEKTSASLDPVPLSENTFEVLALGTEPEFVEGSGGATTLSNLLVFFIFYGVLISGLKIFRRGNNHGYSK